MGLRLTGLRLMALRLLGLGLGLLACSGAQAQFDSSRLWVNAGFYSVHFDRELQLRDPNPGLGLEYRLNTDWSLTAGRFTNSDNAHSNYLGAYWQPWTWAGARWGVVGGVFNGYPKAFEGGWFPAVIPVATWEHGPLGLNVALVPPLKDRLYGALSFQLKLRFSAGN